MDFFHLVKHYLTILILILIVVSCTNSNSNEPQVSTYNNTPEVIDSPKSKLELPDGLEYGKIGHIVFPDSMKAENNLLKQVATYNSALLHGDVNTCAKYLYPDAFEYCRKFYPNFPDEEVLKEFFKDVSGDLQNSLRVWQQNGVDLQIVVYNLEKKIKYNDDIIIVFNVASNLCSEQVYTHTTELEKTIGISQNGGTNFWFMNDHEDLPTILGIHYPQNVVNAIMGY